MPVRVTLAPGPGVLELLAQRIAWFYAMPFGVDPLKV